jgi:hypothetical protein
MSILLGFIIGILFALLVSYRGQGQDGPIDRITL